MSKLRNLIDAVLSHGDAFQTAATDLAAALASGRGVPEFHDYKNLCALRVQAALAAKGIAVEPHPSRKGGALTYPKGSAAEQRLGRLLKLHPGYNAGGIVGHKPDIRTRVVNGAVTRAQALVVDAGMTRAEFVAFMRSLHKAVQFK